MSFGGFSLPFIGTKEEYQELMAKQEIAKRTLNLYKNLLWRYRLRTEISIKWPIGWTPQDHLGNSAESSDPNVWYRDWFEQHAGRQGWAWDWRIGQTHTYELDPLVEVHDTLRIKFRDPKIATLFILTWVR